MSHEYPVFTYPIDYSVVSGRSFDLDEALERVPKHHWCCTSRNWWYQGLLKSVLDAYPGFEALRYLTSVVAVVNPSKLTDTEAAIHRLLDAIAERPEIFVRLVVPHVSAQEDISRSAECVRESIHEAEVSRNLDDDSRFAHGNFFSFLLSQAAALAEARQLAKCLVYARPQSDAYTDAKVEP